jgi:hypothetical protein
MAGAAQPRQPALANAPAIFFHTLAIPLLGWGDRWLPERSRAGR